MSLRAIIIAALLLVAGTAWAQLNIHTFGHGTSPPATANCILISGTTTNCLLISGTTTNALLVK